jgi:hypothetical protein
MAEESSFLGHTAGWSRNRQHYVTALSVACSSTEKIQSSEAQEIGTNYFV